MFLDNRLTRLDANRVRVNNRYGIEAVLFANAQVPVEAARGFEAMVGTPFEYYQPVEQSQPAASARGASCRAAVGCRVEVLARNSA
jgi:hypothetical protein